MTLAAQLLLALLARQGIIMMPLQLHANPEFRIVGLQVQLLPVLFAILAIIDTLIQQVQSLV